jgi:hypothetical protein
LTQSGRLGARLKASIRRGTDYFRTKRGEIKRRLTGLPQIVGLFSAAVACFLAPRVDAAHPADRLQGFFGVAAGLVFTIFLSFGLIQLSSNARPERVLRFFRPRTFIVLALGFAGALAGLITSLDTWTYRYLFAVTIGGLAAGIVCAVAVAFVSVAEQRAAAIASRAAAITSPSGEGSTHEADR